VTKKKNLIEVIQRLFGLLRRSTQLPPPLFGSIGMEESGGVEREDEDIMEDIVIIATNRSAADRQPTTTAALEASSVDHHRIRGTVEIDLGNIKFDQLFGLPIPTNFFRIARPSPE
jgi:hypothetical protein